MTSHNFVVEEAVKYGIEQAVLLNDIRYSLHGIRASNRNCFNGYYWTYPTTKKAYHTLFPYMEIDTIGVHLKVLCNKGALLRRAVPCDDGVLRLAYTIPSEFSIDN